MRAVAGVEDRIIFENGDSGLDGVEGMAARFQDAPSGMQCPEATGLASINGFVGDVPRTAVDDKRWSHGSRE